MGCILIVTCRLCGFGIANLHFQIEVERQDENASNLCDLVEFFMGNCGFFHNRCPQLEELSLKRTGTASAMLQCPRLTSLDVSSCHKLSDAGVRTAAIACPLLLSLNMSNCAYVTDDTLREISLACTQLQTLDASYCPNISLEVILFDCGVTSHTSLDLFNL